MGGGFGIGANVAIGADVTTGGCVGSEMLGRSGILDVTTVGRAAIVTDENAAVVMWVRSNGVDLVGDEGSEPVCVIMDALVSVPNVGVVGSPPATGASSIAAENGIIVLSGLWCPNKGRFLLVPVGTGIGVVGGSTAGVATECSVHRLGFVSLVVFLRAPPPHGGSGASVSPSGFSLSFG